MSRGDAINEPDETFFVNLSNPQNATVSDNQGEDGLHATVTVNRTGDTSAAATVDYATSDNAGLTPCNAAGGIASQRCDYATSIGTLRFAAGETSDTIFVPIVDDGIILRRRLDFMVWRSLDNGMQRTPNQLTFYRSCPGTCRLSPASGYLFREVNMSRANRMCLITILLLLTAGCDQVTKKVAKAELASTGPVSLLSGVVRLEYAENPGAFMSLGEHLPSPVLLVASSLLGGACLFLLVRLGISKQAVRQATLVGLSLTAGGSIGNLIDRVVNGGVVVDFMNIGVGRIRTGIFNLADIAILTGALVLLLSLRKNSARIDDA